MVFLGLKARHAKVLFCGSSGAGKTNFVNLLLYKSFEEKHITTRLTDSHQLIAKQVTITEQSNFEEFDYSQKIEYLKSHLHAIKNERDKQKNEDVPICPVSNGDNRPSETSSIENRSDDKSSIKYGKAGSAYASDLPTINDLASGKSSIKAPDVWDMLTFLDTGGQPEYITMLPAINSSAMITFILHSMEGGPPCLKNKVTVIENGKERGEDLQPNYKYIDLIKMLFSIRKVKVEKTFEELLVDKNAEYDRKCYLSLVGTKSDLVVKLDEEVISMHKELDPIIKAGKHESSLIPINGNYFVPVSNQKAGTPEQDPNGPKFCSCIYEYLQERDVHNIPIVWLILELEILKKTEDSKMKVMHFSQIKEICENHNLIDEEEDIRRALEYFHHIGIFLYYDSLKSIADIVIADYKWVFQNLYEVAKAARSGKPVLVT